MSKDFFKNLGDLVQGIKEAFAVNHTGRLEPSDALVAHAILGILLETKDAAMPTLDANLRERILRRIETVTGEVEKIEDSIPWSHTIHQWKNV